MDAIYDREDSSVCVTCTFMTRSAAMGCAARITNLNTTRNVMLQVSRTNSGQQITSGCAYDLSAGQYRVEVFDVEASEQLSPAAAIVVYISGDGTPQPSISLPTAVMQPSQSPSES